MTNPAQYFQTFDGSTLDPLTHAGIPVLIDDMHHELIVHGYCGIIVNRCEHNHLVVGFYKESEYLEYLHDLDEYDTPLFHLWDVKEGGHNAN